ncbi:MAG: hypothetical protein HYU51_00915, partial [Candidatus Rokubacteria bacterium]|nr:hypothetical protein [Candidatus Rokubacteria bacterium]
NPGGARALRRSLRQVFGERPMTLIAGVLRDKDARAILAELVPAARRIILTRSSNPRSARPEDLRAALPATAAPAEVAASVPAALGLAAASGPHTVVCVAGSLSLVGDALRHLAGGSDKPCSIEKPAASMDSLY